MMNGTDYRQFIPQAARLKLPGGLWLLVEGQCAVRLRFTGQYELPLCNPPGQQLGDRRKRFEGKLTPLSNVL
jgi:hypothetical protein